MGDARPRHRIAELVGASKTFGVGALRVEALRPSDLELRAGELTLVRGPSGSGKTTALSLLGCLLRPTRGRVRVTGIDVGELDAPALAMVRLRTVGFVFQGFNLVAPLTAMENVALPMRLLGATRRAARDRARALLDAFGLGARAGALPRGLSGGEQQRVAIARALANDAPLLCDEPTASLDARAATVVMTHLRALATDGRAVVVVTHDARLSRFADRIVRVADGTIRPEPPDAPDPETANSAPTVRAHPS